MLQDDYRRTIAQIAHTAILMGLTIAGLIYAKSFLVPIVLAVFLTMLLSSLRNAVWRSWWGQRFGKRSSTVVAAVLLFSFNSLLLTTLSSQIGAFKVAIPAYEQNLNSLLASFLTFSHLDEVPNIASVLNKVDIGGFLTWMGESLSLVASNVFLTFLYTLFLIAEKGNLPLKLARLRRNPERAVRINRLCEQITATVQRYIVMKSLISLVTAAASLLMLTAVGVDFAPLWALVIFFLNFIPNIGSLFGVLLPSLLTLLQFDSLTPFILVGIGLTVIQFTIGNLLEPAYLGKQLNLSSFVVLISLSFWGAIWGLVGMFLSVPLLVITSLVCQHTKSLSWVSVLLSVDGNVSQPLSTKHSHSSLIYNERE